MTSTRQVEILAAIRALSWVHGYPPTYRQIAAALGIRSTSTVAYHVHALESAGLLHREPGCPRAIRCTPQPIDDRTEDATHDRG